MKPVRYVLVHYHIFKNAGSTVEYALDRAFGDRFCLLHGPDPDSVLTGADLIGFLGANPEVCAVSSHHLKFPVPEMRGTVLIDWCFLRDPMRRVQSMYQYFRRIDPTDELSERARMGDARSFVEWMVRECPQMINDVQVNLLANGGVYLRPPSQIDFERAAALVDRMAMVGVVDLFDESVTAAEYYLRPVFGVGLHYVRQNSSGAAGVVEASFREQMGAELYEVVAAMNRLDLELVGRAEREVERRFRAIADCEGWWGRVMFRAGAKRPTRASAAGQGSRPTKAWVR